MTILSSDPEKNQNYEKNMEVYLYFIQHESFLYFYIFFLIETNSVALNSYSIGVIDVIIDIEYTKSFLYIYDVIN